MRVTNKKVKKLLDKYKEIYLLNRIDAVLSWDLNVNLPPKASQGRATQAAYLTEVITEKWLDKEFRKLLESAKNRQTSLTDDEKAIVRNLEHQGKLYFKVPKEIIVEFVETSSKAFMVWKQAKIDNKFSDFLPHLAKIIKLNQIIADHLGYKENPYDALLDLFEQGLTSKDCEKVFDKLQPELTYILKKIKQSKIYKKQDKFDPSRFNFPQQDQRQVAMFVLRRMGYDLEAGRMDISPHPFTLTLDSQDVRITNRYKKDDFRDSLMIAMHEAGHALYEQGVDENYDGTPLAGGVSLGIHESQSRFWENQVGRSYEFISCLTPVLHAFYDDQLSKVDKEQLFALFNQVKPSFIRTEADEVTYNLHIALRFDLENRLINKKLKPSDLPEIWRAKMKKYLGVVPPTDREGVLQDVHWSYGAFGYFPTYTLGNLYAAQITTLLKKELNLDELVKNGELGKILSWFRTNIHQYGSLYWPNELIKKVTGKNLSPRYFLDYIKKKYSKIYNLHS
jgi:carboxypeptidase Taq